MQVCLADLLYQFFKIILYCKLLCKSSIFSLHWCGWCLSGSGLLLYPISVILGKYRLPTRLARPEGGGSSVINEIYTWREKTSAEFSKALKFPINQLNNSDQLTQIQAVSTGFTRITAPLSSGRGIARGGHNPISQKNEAKKKSQDNNFLSTENNFLPRLILSSSNIRIDLQLFQDKDWNMFARCISCKWTFKFY